MDLATFKTQYPELRSAGDTLLQAFLDAAALEIDLEIWDTLSDQGQGLLAAHNLTMSPWGQAARMQPKDGVTTYGQKYEKMQSMVAVGYRAI